MTLILTPTSAFVLGMLFGMIVVLCAVWATIYFQKPHGSHGSQRGRYPRKIDAPDLQLRDPDLPTNPDQPASRVTQAQFRARKETQD